MPLGLGLGITKLKSLISGLRVRFQGNATITAALDGILRELSADFVSNGTVTAALEAIKLLSVDFSGDGTLTADLVSFEGLLDLYPNAAAAYSVRLLKSDYTGALVRIRKDTAGQPEKDFYPDSNNELSLNSSDGGTTLGSWIGSNDGYVVTWYDQSGSGTAYDATNSTAAYQPQIINAGALININGKPSLSFDGVNDSLDCGALNTILDSTNSSSSFSVSYANSSNGTVFQSAVSNRFAIQYDVSGNELTVAFFNGSFHSSSKPNSVLVQNLLSHTWDTSAITGYINNVLNTGTENPSTDGTNAAKIGVRSGGSSAFLDGNIQELIFYPSDENANRSGITDEINTYYSVY